LVLVEPELKVDLDGDFTPLGAGWDIGADESDPNSRVGPALQPDRLVYRCSQETTLVLHFRAACMHSQYADRILVQRALDPNAPPVFDAPVQETTPGLNITARDAEGLVTGTLSIESMAELFEQGDYMAKLVSGPDPAQVKAVSFAFFITTTMPLVEP
jgi:hypothetical protein